MKYLHKFSRVSSESFAKDKEMSTKFCYGIEFGDNEDIFHEDEKPTLTLKQGVTPEKAAKLQTILATENQAADRMEAEAIAKKLLQNDAEVTSYENKEGSFETDAEEPVKQLNSVQSLFRKFIKDSTAYKRDAVNGPANMIDSLENPTTAADKKRMGSLRGSMGIEDYDIAA